MLNIIGKQNWLMSNIYYTIDDYEIDTDNLSLATDFDDHDNEDIFQEELDGIFG
jgi:hypothetical protein